ncbi:MAG: DUF2865 domain-containing protein [Pseudomonadota bacterium]
MKLSASVEPARPKQTGSRAVAYGPSGRTSASPFRLPVANLRRGLLAAGVALLASATFTAQNAYAQANCRAIQSELANLVNGGGGGRTGDLQRALNQQRGELARAQNAYDRLGCGFRASGQCNAVVNAIGQMQSNIATIERRIQRGGGGGNQRRIRELERVFATQCGPNQRRQQQAATQPGVGDLLSAIFGIRSAPAPGDPSARVVPGQRTAHRGFDRPGQERVREPEMRWRGNTFRTMCVRKTDGFYWPISFSTTRDRFDEDQGLCAAMCPGTSVELFAYRNPGQQVDAMVSTLTGESYASQSYAFAYRTDFQPSNRCTPSANVLQDLRGSTASVATPVQPSVPQPMARPQLENDPETRALDAGGITFRQLATMSQQTQGEQQLVRVVGPTYRYFTE